MRPWVLAPTLLVFASCAPPPRLNLILLTIDTCRADRLGCYGYDLLRTQNLDRIAAGGVLFEQARTCIPVTLPSHTTILTGLYPGAHGVRDNGRYRVPDSLVTLAEVLRRAGYRTAAFVGAFPLDARFGLDQGFEYYGDEFEGRGGDESAAGGGFSIFYPERRASSVNEEFFTWLRTRAREPFFAWLHYFDPHQPFEPPPPYDALYVGRPYDGEIAFVDECVGQLIRRLEDRGLLDRTVLVVTADHGEALGEHGEVTHALLLHDATLRVPLLIRCPSRMGIRGRVAHPVRTVDLPATLLDLLGVGRVLPGESLVPAMRGGAAPAGGHLLETLYGHFHFGWSPLVGYDVDGFRLVVGRRRELFDLRNDPREERDLADLMPQKADSLFSLVEREQARVGSSFARFLDPDARTTGKLRALGYVVSVGSPGQDVEGPDPRDMMVVHRLFDDARGFAHRGMWHEAIASFREAIRAHPGNADAWVNLVQALVRVGDVRGALETARRVTRDRDDVPEAWVLLSRLELVHGNPLGTLEAARRALASGADPVECWLLVAHAHDRMGDVVASADAYGRVLALDPTNASARLGRARAWALSGKGAEARREFEAVLRQNPYWAPGQYNFGVFLLTQRDTANAIRRFTQAVSLSPGYVAAHHALGTLLVRTGRETEALPHLQIVIDCADTPERKASALELLEGIQGRGR